MTVWTDVYLKNRKRYQAILLCEDLSEHVRRTLIDRPKGLDYVSLNSAPDMNRPSFNLDVHLERLWMLPSYHIKKTLKSTGLRSGKSAVLNHFDIIM